MNNIVSIVLAGGCSRRLYPIATALKPKQFLNGSRLDALFKENVDFACETSKTTILISASRYRNNVLMPLNHAQRSTIQFIFEPCMRNTLSATALGAMMAREKFNDPIIFITPADLIYQNKQDMLRAISEIASKHEDSNITFFHDAHSVENKSFYGPFLCRASKVLSLIKSAHDNNFAQLIKSLKNGHVRQNELNISYEDYSSVADLEFKKEILQSNLNIQNHIINSRIFDLNTVEDFFNLHENDGQIELDKEMKNIDVKSFNQFSQDYFIATSESGKFLRRKTARQTILEEA
jgi:hypothetical protein